MKRYFLFIVIAVITLSMVSCEGSYVVTSEPVAPYYERPVAPGAGFIWIDGDWIFEGGHYVWHEGHWGRPRGHRSWQGGHWEGKGNGWHWKRGHWH